MKPVVDKDKLNNLTNEIWKSAERLRGKFKAYEYQTVILPIIVIRRLECVLIQWRENQAAEIKKKRSGLKDKAVMDLVKKLELNPKKARFSNTTAWTLEKICQEDPTLMEKHFRAYINGFSENVQEIIEHFNYREVIGRMVKNSRLSPILNQYAKAPLGPGNLTNLEMGYVYEELLRRFSEQSGEEAGEHFTPREVIRLMVELLEIPIPEKHISVYDPACGTGGMLTVAKEYLFDQARTEEEKARVQQLVTLHGHELSPGNYAICKADMLIKDEEAKICFGNSLIPNTQNSREPGDQLAAPKDKFDYMLSNPPFGVTWGGKDGYEREAKKFADTRYSAGMPRTNDGAFLFLQTMLAKMKPAEKGGSKIAIIFNGSPLSNGDCGSGESEIRRWILENDWLEAIVMLPDQLFYNTGIFTYIWLLTNKKPVSRQNRVMLIDGRTCFEKEPRSFGNKRNRLAARHMKTLKDLYQKGWDKGDDKDETVKIFKTTDFAFHKVSVVFWQTDETDAPAYVTEPYTKALTPASIKNEQTFYDSDLEFSMSLASGERKQEVCFTLKPGDAFPKVFEKVVKAAFRTEIKRLTTDLKTVPEKNRAIKAFIRNLDKQVVYTHRRYVSDTEYIPFGQDIEAFLKQEIEKPIIRWNDSPQPGYEILPNKYFYRYEPPKPADELLKEFCALEKEAEDMLKKVMGKS